MPGFDGTGPFGRGVLSGRGFGPCGRGREFGRGYQRRFAFAGQPALAKDEQKKILEAELKGIEAEKIAIEEKLKEL